MNNLYYLCSYLFIIIDVFILLSCVLLVYVLSMYLLIDLCIYSLMYCFIAALWLLRIHAIPNIKLTMCVNDVFKGCCVNNKYINIT